MKNIIFTLLILCVFTITYGQDQTISKSYKDIKTIRLATASGDIELKKSSGSEVKVVLKHSYDSDEFEPVFEVNGGRLTLEEKFDRGNHSGNSKWSLEIPDGISLKVNTGSGDVSVDGLNIDMTSNTGSGNIMLTSVKGDLDFNTGSGDIEIEKAEGEVKLNTGSGRITASNGTGFYSFNAGSGDIRLSKLKGDFRINTGSGDVSGKELTLTGSSSFNTGSGDATVTLSSALDFNISVNSGSGNSTLNFNGNAINGQVVMSANKRGGDIVAPFKFDSEEVIDDHNSNARIEKTAKIGNKDIKIRVSTGSGTAEIAK
jgi:hypothetical protein